MKSIRSFFILSILFAVFTAVNAQSNLDVTLLGDESNTVLLSDNFQGVSVDDTRWSVESPWADSSVVVDNASVTSRNHGYLISKDSFTGNLEINYMVKLVGDRTSATFVWKTDGTYSNQDLSTSPFSGMVVVLAHESQQVHIGVINGPVSSANVNLQLETWYQVRIIDNDGVASVHFNGSVSPVATLKYDRTSVGENGKIDFFSRESKYCGPVGASITALTVSNLTPEPTEMVVTLTEPMTLTALVIPETVIDTPAMEKSVVQEVSVPSVIVTDSTTGKVVATDVVLSGDPSKDCKNFSDRHRKAYGVKIAQHNRLKGAHCATTKKLPAGIYTFTFQQKSGAKNCKFGATVIRVDDDDDGKGKGKGK